MVISLDSKLLKTICELNQEYILSKYWGLAIEEIEYCLESKSHKTRNPLRNDENPSLGMMYVNSKYGIKLTIKDFADAYYTGDLIHCVGIALRLNSNNPKEFIAICNHILDNYHTSISLSDNISIKLRLRETYIYTYEYREFNELDIRYWKQYDLHEEFLSNQNVYAINYLWQDGRLIYSYKNTDPCYGYYLATRNDIDIYQFYFPKRRKSILPRFITNNRARTLGTANYNPNSKVVIIAKSKKDELVLLHILKAHSLLSTNGVITIPLVSILTLSSENGAYLTSQDIAIMKNEYKFIFLDYDRSGIKAMNYHKKYYNCIPLYIKDTKAKDISDYVSVYGRDKANELINNFISNYFNVKL